MSTPAMNTELVLEAPRRVSDGGGGFEVVWAPVGTVWVDMRSIGARERVSGVREAEEWAPNVSARVLRVRSEPRVVRGPLPPLHQRALHLVHATDPKRQGAAQPRQRPV